MALSLLFHICTFFPSAVLLLAGLPCNIESASETVQGELTQLDAAQATFLVDGKETQLPIDQLRKISTKKDRQELLKDTISIQTTDESVLMVRDLHIKDAQVDLWPLGSEPDSTPQSNSRKTVKLLRFHLPTDALQAQWKEITTADHAGDTLIIRKSGEALDFLEGVVTAMDGETLTFQYDGDEIPVKRTKLEGVLFYQAKREEDLPPPASILGLLDNSTLNCKSLALADGQIKLTTVDGFAWSAPASLIGSVDYAAGQTLFLSDVDPAELVVTPHIASSLNEELTKLLYQPRKDKSTRNRPLSLRSNETATTTEYAKGLCLHSRTEATYRLGKQYRRLQSVVGIDPQLGEGGAVHLIVKGDDKELFNEQIRAGAEPQQLDLDVSGQRRVTILVDYADNLDVADRVHLCNLKVIK